MPSEGATAPGGVQAGATAGGLGAGRARGGSGSGAGASLQGVASSVGLLGLPRRTRRPSRTSFSADCHSPRPGASGDPAPGPQGSERTPTSESAASNGDERLWGGGQLSLWGDGDVPHRSTSGRVTKCVPPWRVWSGTTSRTLGSPWGQWPWQWCCEGTGGLGSSTACLPARVPASQGSHLPGPSRFRNRVPIKRESRKERY